MLNRKGMAVFFLSMIVLTGIGLARQTKADVTLLMVPRNKNAIQIGLDLAFKGYPTILMTYQQEGAESEPVLHAWNKNSWVYISPSDYVNGSFCTASPKRTIIIGQDGLDAPSELIPDSRWCSLTYRSNETKTDKLLTFIGKVYDFSYPTWEWFAQRYGYEMKTINPDNLNDKWYYHTLVDNLFKKNPPHLNSRGAVELPMESGQMQEVEEWPETTNSWSVQGELVEPASVIENPLGKIPHDAEVIEEIEE